MRRETPVFRVRFETFDLGVDIFWLNAGMVVLIIGDEVFWLKFGPLVLVRIVGDGAPLRRLLTTFPLLRVWGVDVGLLFILLLKYILRLCLKAGTAAVH